MDILAYVIPGLVVGLGKQVSGVAQISGLTKPRNALIGTGVSGILLGGLLIASIPGIISGSLIGRRLPETILRRILALTLLAVAPYLILRRVI